ncbi:MAG TPA: TetR/AcrR family transcriptional regulator [Chloroflexota bacterium]|jgi:AcrR family transcriptional regulator
MPRADVSETRKSQILDAAATVFARLGFHQARMDDIAAEARLSKGALYLYYKSKDAIVFAILRLFFGHALQDLRAPRTSTGSVAAQLFDIIHQATAEMERIPGVQAISFEFYAVAARQSAVRDYLRSYFGEFRDGLAAIIQRGIDSGEFRAGMDPQAAAFTVVALMEGLALLWMMDPQAVRPASDGEQALRLLLDGMRTPLQPMADK